MKKANQVGENFQPLSMRMRYVPNKKLQIIRLSSPSPIMNRNEDNKSAWRRSWAAASRWRINKSKHYSSIRIYLMLLSMSEWFWCEWVSCGKQEIASEINCTQCKLWKVCQHVVEIGKCAVDLLLLHHCSSTTFSVLENYEWRAPWTYAKWSHSTDSLGSIIIIISIDPHLKKQELSHTSKLKTKHVEGAQGMFQRINEWKRKRKQTIYGVEKWRLHTLTLLSSNHTPRTTWESEHWMPFARIYKTLTMIIDDNTLIWSMEEAKRADVCASQEFREEKESENDFPCWNNARHNLEPADDVVDKKWLKCLHELKLFAIQTFLLPCSASFVRPPERLFS